MNKLQTIREAIIKANPSILNLEFGCNIKYKKEMYKLLSLRYSERNGDYLILYSLVHTGCPNISPKYAKIIGRDIKLSDVLLAISKDYEKDEDNHWVFFGSQKQDILMVVANWNLKNDNLENQSEECLSFLAELLK